MRNKRWLCFVLLCFILLFSASPASYLSAYRIACVPVHLLGCIWEKWGFIWTTSDATLGRHLFTWLMSVRQQYLSCRLTSWHTEWFIQVLFPHFRQTFTNPFCSAPKPSVWILHRCPVVLNSPGKLVAATDCESSQGSAGCLPSWGPTAPRIREILKVCAFVDAAVGMWWWG